MLFSIIMPVYNSEKYIRRAILSVINQTYTSWELIIVDDCSTDGTFDIVNHYHKIDSRIRYKKLKQNTGTAYIPRKEAVIMARGEYVVTLDSDDYLENTYLDKISKRLEKTSYDIVCGRMHIVSEEEKETGNTVPDVSFDTSQILSGKEAFRLTIPWKIGLNGASFKKEIFLKSLNEHNRSEDCIYGDEVHGRIMLLNCKSIAFTDAKYFYRTNPNSLVHTFSSRIFHMKDSYLETKDLCIRVFGENSLEHYKSECYLKWGLDYAFNQYLRGKESLTSEERKEYIDKFRDWYNSISWKKVKKNMGLMQQFLYGNGFFLYYMSNVILFRKQCLHI